MDSIWINLGKVKTSYAGEAEKFQILVLDVRSRTLGEKHQDTIRAKSHG